MPCGRLRAPLEVFGSSCRVVKADSHVADGRIHKGRLTNGLIFTKQNIYCYYFGFGTYTA